MRFQDHPADPRDYLPPPPEDWPTRQEAERDAAEDRQLTEPFVDDDGEPEPWPVPDEATRYDLLGAEVNATTTGPRPVIVTGRLEQWNEVEAVVRDDDGYTWQCRPDTVAVRQ